MLSMLQICRRNFVRINEHHHDFFFRIAFQIAFDSVLMLHSDEFSTVRVLITAINVPVRSIEQWFRVRGSDASRFR